MPLRVGYVREHFCSPLLQFEEEDKKRGQERTFTLVECPSGTGQIISRLTNDEIDIAIALTDPLIAGIAKGSQAYKLVGTYVTSPLIWAVVTGPDSSYHKISDLKGTTLGISRHGSGSQTMAHVMALKDQWPTDTLKFEVKNDIEGLIASVNDRSTSAFMWEHFTTKPYWDAGRCRRITDVPTPWSSWLIAAHPTRAPASDVEIFLESLSEFVRGWSKAGRNVESCVKFIQGEFLYHEDDIKDWLEIVDYPEDCAKIENRVIDDTLDVLVKAGVLKSPEGGFDPNQFVDKSVRFASSAQQHA